MKRTYRRIGLVAALAVLSSLGYAGTAAAHHGSSDPATACGQVVTADLTLTHDVGPCPSDGLVVAASGTSTGPNYLTINLNGYTVFGPTQSTSRAGPCSLNPLPYSASLGAGVLIQGQSWVEVKGSATARGTIKCFSGGVEIKATATARVTNNVVTTVDVKANVGNVASDWGEGIGIWGDGNPNPTNCDNNTVTGNTVDSNGPYGGIALYNGANCNQIGGPDAPGDPRRNTVSNNNAPALGATTNQNDGIRLEPDSRDNTVENNLVTGSALDGISLFLRATGNTVKSNDVQSNGDITVGGTYPQYTHRKGNGINLFSGADSNTLTGNNVTSNQAHGIFVAAKGNSVNGNTATGNNTSGGSNTDLNDARPDLKCGNTETPLLPNHWGNVTVNTFGSRNRDPASTLYADCIS